MNGTISMVSTRSLGLRISRAAMIAGTLQPKPMSIGTNERPWRPTRCMIVSMIYASRAMYPLSSIREMKKKSMMMFGRNASTAPTPLSTPSMKRLESHPSAMWVRHRSHSQSIPVSIHSCGYPPSMNVHQKTK